MADEDAQTESLVPARWWPQCVHEEQGYELTYTNMLHLVLVVNGMSDFSAWRQHHAREYASAAAEAAARATWSANQEMVKLHNARASRGQETYRMSMRGPFADLTNAQYRARMLRPTITLRFDRIA